MPTASCHVYRATVLDRFGDLPRCHIHDDVSYMMKRRWAGGGRPTVVCMSRRAQSRRHFATVKSVFVADALVPGRRPETILDFISSG